MHLQRLFRHLAGEVDGGVEGIAAKAARQLRALLRQLDHAFADHGEISNSHRQ